MSFYFNIKSEKSITFKELYGSINQSNLAFNAAPVDSDEAIIGTKIYVPNKSTRGVTISFQNNDYSIGINVIASEDDFRLAVDTAKNIGMLTGKLIQAEDSEHPFQPSELSERFNQDWIDMMKTLAVNLFLEKIGKENQILSIGCCFMNYSVGPKIHSTLDTSSELNYYHSLVSHIQNTQFFDQNKYNIPNIIATQSQEGTNKKRILVFYPHGSEFLTKADFVVFPVGEDRYEIPYSMLSAIATDKFTLVDEEQYVIDALSEEEYQNIINAIETELSKISESELELRYAQFTDEQLNDEFNRFAGIPNARTKIFALTHVSVLIGEYKKRGLEMPNKKGNGKAPQNKSPRQHSPPVAPPKPKPSKPSPPPTSTNLNTPKKKKWWKFWSDN